MGKSRIKDSWLRSENKKQNKANGTHHTEKPMEWRGLGKLVDVYSTKIRYIKKNIGHKRTKLASSMLSGIVRMKLKEQAREEIDAEYGND